MKKTFIRAISDLFRIDISNILTAGALEAIINRLEITDYQMFISYLGERNSSFEKPIESITKGVIEFLEIKNRPKVSYAEKMAIEIQEIFINVRIYFSDRDKFNEFLKSNRDSKIFHTLVNSEMKQKIFTEEILDICFGVGLDKIASQLDKKFIKKEPTGFETDFYFFIKESNVYKCLTKDLSVSVTKQIENSAEKKQLMSLSEITDKAKLISNGFKNE